MTHFLPDSVDDILNRVDELRDLNQPHLAMRRVTKAIMNGNAEAVSVLISDADMDYLPAANLMYSAMERLSQKLGKAPQPRVDSPTTTDSANSRRNAEKRERILEAYDRAAGLNMQMPQIARWVAGYGFGVWTLQDAMTRDGQPFPQLELRDPYGCLPGPWTVHQQPDDLAFIRRVPEGMLKKMYPALRNTRLRPTYYSSGGAVLLDNTADSQWANQGDDYLIRVVEYRNKLGTYLILEDSQILLDFEPSPESVGTPFVVAKRFAFDQLIGQYEHVKGLQQMLTRLNVLAFLAVQDAVFSEALTLDTPIPTPHGWTTMGEIEVGDFVLGANGQPVEVTKATDTQHDRVTYRVTFEDGTYVDASDGHLWEARPTSTRQALKVWTTQEMVDDGRRFRVPAREPVALPEAPLDLDPYMLGVWLGDGSSNAPIITIGEDVWDEQVRLIEERGFVTKEVSTSDDRCGQVYVSTPDSVSGKHGSGLSGSLRALGLLGNKHVPDVYLRGSIQQRLNLVRGLMDTDGSVSKSGHCSFTNSNWRIVDAMMEVLRSLGEVPHLKWLEDDRSRKGGYWLVHWTARQFNPCSVSHKAERVKMHARGGDQVTITSIERIDTAPVRCIAVASEDHLFLAGRGMHVTHNTNIYGEMISDEYRRGRGATNHFESGTRVERPTDGQVFQSFQQQDRLERQLRLTGAYPVTDDAQSPNSFVTGQGLRELTQSADNVVGEYQMVFSHTLEIADTKRFAWDEEKWGNINRVMPGYHDGAPYVEKYRPDRDINGNYLSRRAYGLLSGLDSSSKLIGLLQISQAGWMDDITAMENLDGIDNIQQVRERLDHQRSEEILQQALLGMAQGQQMNPEVLRVLIDGLEEGPRKDRFESVFFPEPETEVNPETGEEEPVPGQEPPLAAPGEDPQTIMSRLFGTGGGNAQAQLVQTQ